MSKKKDVRIAAAPVPIEAMEREAKEHSGDAAAQLRYGWALYGAGRLQEAQKVLDAAQRAHTSDIEVLYALALTERRLGEPERARSAFHKIDELIPAIADRTRAAVLRRITHGHLHMLERGRWDLEKEIWGRGLES